MSLVELGFDPRSLTPEKLWDFLCERSDEAVADFEQSEQWQRMINPDVDILFIRTAMREIFREIAVIRTGIVKGAETIQRRKEEREGEDFFSTMPFLLDDCRKHGETAPDDYIRLGGISSDLEYFRPSAEASVALAVWREIKETCDMFTWLGAYSCYTSITERIAIELLGLLERRERECSWKFALDYRGLEFLQQFAGESMGRSPEFFFPSYQEISEVLSDYPEAATNIAYAWYQMVDVGPLRAWLAAIRRAERLHRYVV